MLHSYKAILFSLSFCLLLSCAENTPPPVTPVVQIPPPIAITPQVIAIDSNLTRIAQLMAGMDSLSIHSNEKWDSKPIHEFCRETSRKYENMENSRLSPMSNWNKNNLLSTQTSDSASAFYPFSGGDFIHLQWLYPNASSYFMVAKESVGTVPNLSAMDPDEVMKYLEGVDMVLRDIYTKSYFITKNMITDIRSANLVDGMLPIVVWAAARTGYEIIAIDHFNIDTTGTSVPAEPQKAKGAVVKIKDKIQNKIKSITYLSADISDDGFIKRPEVKIYLDKTIPANCNSFVKSASYLMHYRSFKDIRNFILEKSNAFVQDDTGIPFEYFDNSQWNIHLYGKYEKPVIDFSKNLFQSDLHAAYKNESFYKGAIDFSLGYHWGSGNQNQMFAFKRK